MINKLLKNNGESLIEVLVSLLIICLCILMLQGSIVTAAKVNQKNQNNIEPFRKDGDSTPTQINVKLTDYYDNPLKDEQGIIEGKININIYQSESGYHYYE